jgi:tRNA nucleotidyltransferase/poly(A) polymerase
MNKSSFSKHQLFLETLVKQIVAEEMRKQMHIPLPDDLMKISNIFKGVGRQFLLVGGSVRDALLGKTPKDYDLATDATPDQVIAILKKYPEYKILEIGKSFGVIKVVTPEKNEYEIATFREDIGSGRRPDAVSFTNIEKDVQRRDLTINALFYDIEKQEVVDYVGGIQDLEQGIVRTVGKPSARFDEDRLRVLRALRFAGRLGSKLDPATDQAIKDDNSLGGVSGERIRDEFIKGISSAKNPKYFLGLVSTYEMWEQIFPGLSVNTQFTGTRNIPVQLSLLLRDNDPRELPLKLNKLKYPANEISQVSFLVAFQALTPENAFKLKKLEKNSHLSPKDVEEFSKIAGRPSQQLTQAFLEFQPSVTGDDLQKAGFQGKDLGDEMSRRETENFKKFLHEKKY